MMAYYSYLVPWFCILLIVIHLSFLSCFSPPFDFQIVAYTYMIL
jgi:hypothetical protein